NDGVFLGEGRILRDQVGEIRSSYETIREARDRILHIPLLLQGLRPETIKEIEIRGVPFDETLRFAADVGVSRSELVDGLPRILIKAERKIRLRAQDFDFAIENEIERRRLVRHEFSERAVEFPLGKRVPGLFEEDFRPDT